MANQKKWYLWGNDLNGITAASPGKSIAWGLIRNECAERKMPIPLFNQVREIRLLSEDEVEYLKKRNK